MSDIADSTTGEIQTAATNEFVRDLLSRAAQYRHQVEIDNDNNDYIRKERLCLEQAANHLFGDTSMDIGACFVVHARLAYLYHQLTTVDESFATVPLSDINPSTDTNMWERRADEAAAIAVKMYIKVFDGRTQYRKDNPYQRLMKFLNALLLRRQPLLQEQLSVTAKTSIAAKIVYTKRSLKNIRNGLRMCGALDRTPGEMLPYRDITDAPCDDVVCGECDEEKKDENVVTVHKSTSKERRKQLRMLKFDQHTDG